MSKWRCEACGAVYERRVRTCPQCGDGLVTEHDDPEGLGRVTDSEKVETFDAWGVVDWLFLGLILSVLASLVFGVLQSVGGV